MSYIDSYKRLEKLCSELFGNSKGVTAYIDEMLSISDGQRYVKNWNQDLKKLKHYRWVRNRIVHEPGCTEKNMCTAEDEQWISSFCFRIMHQTDPLALYRKATKNNAIIRKAYPTTQDGLPVSSYYNPDFSSDNTGCVTFVIASLLIAAGVVLIAYIL